MKLNRLSLNVVGLNRIGLNRIGSPSRGSSSGSDRPYIDPEVLASLKAVCICYGKSNDDPDRAIVKNLVDPDNPFVISNAAYTEGSGYADKGSPYYGAFVTDGIDDLITSTKTAEEMGITDEVTVVSMIHQIALNSTYNNGFTNYIENLDKSSYVRNNIYNTGKTGIYGYSASLINRTASNINDILGDKKDYGVEIINRQNTLNSTKFSVIGRASSITEVSSVAWYWTIIANKVLTTDQINQVIAYFNLDRTLKPDILCDVKKQGITNENHAEFGDRLIDFSGNGRDIQLNNIAWDGDSGIGKYNYPNWKVNVTQGNKYARIVYYDSINGTYSANFKGITDLYKSYGLSIEIRVNRANTVDFHSIKEDGIYTITPPDDTTSIDIRFGGENVYNASCDITITQIPSHAGALCLDGINDFGKVTGIPMYKDYTVIAKYQRLTQQYVSGIGGTCLISKSHIPNQGSFIIDAGSSSFVKTQCYSFGALSSTLVIDNSISCFHYQTKYIFDKQTINTGEGIDSDTLWLGLFRDKDSRFFNGVIYSLMSFPYSMSEFLIERQLKKHKLGTLYPDMVEFRPVIKANNDYEIVYTAIIKPNNWQEISVGDYVTVGESVAIQIKLNNPLEVTNVSSNSLADVSFYKEETGDNVYTIYGRLLDGKSPQKISLTIEQDENYVLFNPTINSNAVLEVGNEETMPELFTQLNNGEIDGIILYMQGDKAVLPNNWIDKNTKVRAIIYCLDTVSEEDIHFTVDGKTKYCYSAIEDGLAAFGIMDEDSQEEQYMTNVLTANTIDIQLDQYIRYEDIVQPYPVLLRFNDENGNEVSWGGKFRVGSTITRIGSFYENNLIDGLYIVRNPKLNGNNLITPTHVVEKSMVFTCTATWAFDNNEPKSILSPRLLRIPNSSYKILGYIPDISGHGNHGKINNSAYAGASGANGYLQNFSGWTKASGVSSTDSVISSSNNLVAANGWIAYVTSGTVIPTFKVEISGIPVNGNLRFEGSDQTLVNGVNTIQGITTTKVTGFYISSGYDNDWSNLKIEQIGEYEGAYCFDGVDDFVTIPTLSSGGKQVLMKVNWQNDYNVPGYMYDSNTGEYRNYIIKGNKEQIAYENASKTYIDGIQNSNITSGGLKDITHNITSQFNGTSGTSYIGCRYSLENFLKMALYDFMLFDEISTDDKIKELNEYVGIEGNVWGILTQLSNSTLISNETLIKNE